MRKGTVLSILLSLTIIFGMLSMSGCIFKKKDSGDGYMEVVSDKMGFSTKCLSEYAVSDTDEGLYIYTGEAGSKPYVLVARYTDIEIDAGQYLEEVIGTDMQETLGDALTDTGIVQQYVIGGKTLTGISFTYTEDGKSVNSLHLCESKGGELIFYTAEYFGDGDSVTMEALNVAVENFRIGGETETLEPSGTGEVLDVTPTESSSVTYTTYSDPSGYFTAEIPQGWVVDVGLRPSGDIDLISYAITIYDPNNQDRMLYYNLNCVPGVKSMEAHNWYVTYYGESDYYAKLPVIPEVSTFGLFAGMGPYYGYSDFSVLENLGASPFGGDVLVAECTSAQSGKKLEGIFTASLLDSTYNVQSNMFDFSAGQVDVAPLTAFTIIMETAPQEEFLDWQPVLDHCLSTINFSQSFMSQRQQQWAQLMNTTSYIMQTSNEVSDMIMDSWESRNKTYDVASQKQSDATLGYERVYDTETNEYYKAELGFGDWYDGQRYQVVNDDNAYLSPVSGYINWK